MTQYNCPSCGAELVFKSNVSVYQVCKYCGTMVVRHDVDVESIGKMAALPDDMSPLQIGTEGVYKGIHFVIIGRMKIGWQEGAWNEWYIWSDDNKRGWLAEAQGSYAIGFEIEEDKVSKVVREAVEQIYTAAQPQNTKPNESEPEEVSPNEDAVPFSRASSIASRLKEEASPSAEIDVGAYLEINKIKYKIADIKQAKCIGSEGELPFKAPIGRKTLSIDLLGEKGEFVSIEKEDDKIRIFLGSYIEWHDMKCANLRQLEGW